MEFLEAGVSFSPGPPNVDSKQALFSAHNHSLQDMHLFQIAEDFSRGSALQIQYISASTAKSRFRQLLTWMWANGKGSRERHKYNLQSQVSGKSQIFNYKSLLAHLSQGFCDSLNTAIILQSSDSAFA